jgi:hypothetical protein
MRVASGQHQLSIGFCGEGLTLSMRFKRLDLNLLIALDMLLIVVSGSFWLSGRREVRRLHRACKMIWIHAVHGPGEYFLG